MKRRRDDEECEKLRRKDGLRSHPKKLSKPDRSRGYRRKFSGRRKQPGKIATMKVKKQFVGHIIGKKGVMVRKISMQSGCRIQVHSKGNLSTDGLVPVTITTYGNQKNLKTAREMIERVICDSTSSYIHPSSVMNVWVYDFKGQKEPKDVHLFFKKVEESELTFHRGLKKDYYCIKKSKETTSNFSAFKDVFKSGAANVKSFVMTDWNEKVANDIIVSTLKSNLNDSKLSNHTLEPGFCGGSHVFFGSFFSEHETCLLSEIMKKEKNKEKYRFHWNNALSREVALRISKMKGIQSKNEEIAIYHIVDAIKRKRVSVCYKKNGKGKNKWEFAEYYQNQVDTLKANFIMKNAAIDLRMAFRFKEKYNSIPKDSKLSKSDVEKSKSLRDIEKSIELSGYKINSKRLKRTQIIPIPSNKDISVELQMVADDENFSSSTCELLFISQRLNELCRKRDPNQEERILKAWEDYRETVLQWTTSSLPKVE